MRSRSGARGDSRFRPQQGMTMKKSLIISLTDEELLDLYRVIIDQDAEASLEFVTRYLKKKVIQALEGG